MLYSDEPRKLPSYFMKPTKFMSDLQGVPIKKTLLEKCCNLVMVAQI